MSGMDFNTPTKDLCYHTNQLSVHQLMAYHICCQVYKIKDTKLPVYHYSRLFNNTDNQNIGLGNRVRKNETKRVEFDLSLGRSNFFYQAASIWSCLPNEIEDSPKLSNFKKKCRNWIKEKIQIKP